MRKGGTIMKIKFCGAATSVTGSCHLVDTGKYKFLLDCGQFQGGKAIEALNLQPFEFNPKDLDFMILSHAHIDHCGRIPLLVMQGFNKDIYCTDATADLVAIMLRDSAHIQEKEADSINKKNKRLGRPLVAPMYTVKDAEAALPFLKSVLYGQDIQINEDISIRFSDAGHILGSAISEIYINDFEGENNGTKVKLVFSGDLGVADRPILKDPTPIASADYLILESTYGNRLHTPNVESVNKLMEVVLKTIRRGGTVVIPAFSVGRTQELLFVFSRFFEDHPDFKKQIGNTPVYVDSPMAAAATQVFRENAHVFDDETHKYLMSGENPLDFPNLKFVQSGEESRSLNYDTTPKVIISASGMCEAGRIKHHLKHNIWDSRNSIVFVGFQAEGTLGRTIVDGEKNIKIFGESIIVAAEIYKLEGFTGHADKNGLLQWLSGFKKPPKMTFLVHGEEQSKLDLAAAIREKLKLPCETVMGMGAEYVLNTASDVVAVSGIEPVSVQVPEEPEKLLAYLKMKEQLASIHSDIENILDNTQLASDKALPDDKMQAISNLLLELQKNVINLGSAVTLENPIGTAGETGGPRPQ